MDGQLKAKVKTLTMELAREEHARLRTAGTMIDLEELAEQPISVRRIRRQGPRLVSLALPSASSRSNRSRRCQTAT